MQREMRSKTAPVESADDLTAISSYAHSLDQEHYLNLECCLSERRLGTIVSRKLDHSWNSRPYN